MRNSKTDCSFSLQDDFLRVGLPQRHEKNPKRFVERLTDAVRYAAKWLKSSALKLSEKGSEQRSEGGFGRYEEAEMGRKEPSGRSVGLRHGHRQDFSDSLRIEILGSSR